MLEGIKFIYNGISSEDMGLMNVKLETGMYEESFLASREIRETKIPGRDKPYFQGVTRNPLVFSLSFAFEDVFDESKIRSVARWLSQNYYKPFYTESNPNRIYYCMLESDSNLLHNGLQQGYVSIKMRCDSPYSYSPEYISQLYDLSINPSGTNITFINNGDIPLFPELWITKVGNGDVSIFNNSNGGIEFKFISLVDGEIIYVDCENEYISSSIPLIYRYDSFNGNNLELLIGNNVLNIVGTCQIQFRYRFKTLQG